MFSLPRDVQWRRPQNIWSSWTEPSSNPFRSIQNEILSSVCQQPLETPTCSRLPVRWSWTTGSTASTPPVLQPSPGTEARLGLSIYCRSVWAQWLSAGWWDTLSYIWLRHKRALLLLQFIVKYKPPLLIPPRLSVLLLSKGMVMFFLKWETQNTISNWRNGFQIVFHFKKWNFLKLQSALIIKIGDSLDCGKLI